jgi:hypothetical protein
MITGVYVGYQSREEFHFEAVVELSTVLYHGSLNVHQILFQLDFHPNDTIFLCNSNGEDRLMLDTNHGNGYSCQLFNDSFRSFHFGVIFQEPIDNPLKGKTVGLWYESEKKTEKALVLASRSSEIFIIKFENGTTAKMLLRESDRTEDSENDNRWQILDSDLVCNSPSLFI